MYNNVRGIDKDRMVDECLSLLRNRVVELNLFQLDYGLNAGGKKFSKYKTKRYAKKKSGMNSRPGFGNPDLKLTGDFWEAFKTDIRSGVLDIYSTDRKAGWLEDRYKLIYGLTKESMGVLRNEFLILFNQRLKMEIGLQ